MSVLAEFVCCTGLLKLPVLLYSLRRANLSVPFDLAQGILMEWTPNSGMSLNQLIDGRDSCCGSLSRACERSIQSIIGKCNGNQSNYMTFIPSPNVYCFQVEHEYPNLQSILEGCITRAQTIHERTHLVGRYHRFTQQTVEIKRIYTLSNGEKEIKSAVKAGRDHFYFMMRPQGGIKHLKSRWSAYPSEEITYQSRWEDTAETDGPVDGYTKVEIGWCLKPGYRIRDIVKTRHFYHGRPLPGLTFWQTLGIRSIHHFNLSGLPRTHQDELRLLSGGQ